MHIKMQQNAKQRNGKISNRTIKRQTTQRELHLNADMPAR